MKMGWVTGRARGSVMEMATAKRMEMGWVTQTAMGLVTRMASCSVTRWGTR